MKRALIVSLLLISVFVISNAAEARIGDCQDYWCTYTVTCDGEYDASGEECTTLCTYDSVGDIGGYWYGCDLVALDSKNLLGDGGSMGGDIACSVSLYGRSMTLLLSLTEAGCTERHNCVPCYGCCDSFK